MSLTRLARADMVSNERATSCPKGRKRGAAKTKCFCERRRLVREISQWGKSPPAGGAYRTIATRGTGVLNRDGCPPERRQTVIREENHGLPCVCKTIPGELVGCPGLWQFPCNNSVMAQCMASQKLSDQCFNLRWWFAIGSFGSIAGICLLSAFWVSTFMTESLLERDGELSQAFLERIVGRDGTAIF